LITSIRSAVFSEEENLSYLFIRHSVTNVVNTTQCVSDVSRRISRFLRFCNHAISVFMSVLHVIIIRLPDSTDFTVSIDNVHTSENVAAVLYVTNVISCRRPSRDDRNAQLQRRANGNGHNPYGFRTTKTSADSFGFETVGTKKTYGPRGGKRPYK